MFQKHIINYKPPNFL